MMNQRPRNDDRRRNNEQTPNPWVWGLAAGAAAALAGGVYYLSVGSRRSENNVKDTEISTNRDIPRTAINNPRNSNSNSSSHSGALATPSTSRGNFLTFCTDLINTMTFPPRFQGIPRSSVPARPSITNINSLMDDIYVRFIALKNEDFQLYYSVFCGAFKQIQAAMEAVDPFYAKYSSRKQFAGSHYDGLRIVKPDEFDFDIVIKMPVNFKENSVGLKDSDIYIEAKSPAFVQLKMGTQFQTLYRRDGTDCLVNVTAYQWMDSKGYLQRDKFINWFKGVVTKAMNSISSDMNGWSMVIDGRSYKVKISHGGNSTSVTLYITDGSGFKLDVDLVPAFKFPMTRWPVSRGYRSVAAAEAGDWMVVPKPDRAAPPHDQPRSWRLALHEQEKQLMHDNKNLKQTIRLMKKLRDAQGMTKIASYYIKTLFFWEIERRASEPNFWSQNSPAELFKIMVSRLQEALVKGNIPYYWNKKFNLLAGAGPGACAQYAARVRRLAAILDRPAEYKEVAKFMLSADEYADYKKFLA